MAEEYDLFNKVRKALLTCHATSISEIGAVRVGLKDRYLLEIRLHIAGWCGKRVCVRECGRWIANAR